MQNNVNKSNKKSQVIFFKCFKVIEKIKKAFSW